MQISKRVIWITLTLIIIALSWRLWNWATTPPYHVITEKPVFGNASSRIVMLEFSDLQCPACKAAHPTITRIMREYQDVIQFRYLHYPLTSIHRYADQAAQAAECANDAGKYFEFIDAAFAISPQLSRSNLIDAAQSLGIHADNFTACLDSGWKSRFVALDVREGNAHGVTGTPTIFINEKKAESWDYTVLSQMIEEALSQNPLMSAPGRT